MSADKPLAVVLVDEGYEDLEVHYPRLRLEEAGFHVEVVGEKAGHNYNSKHDYWAKTTKVFKDIDASKVKVLVIPGGWAPDRLRRSKECLDLVVACNEHKAIIAHICHGGWVPISAKIIKGKKSTCFVAIKDDLINAGAEYSEDRCVVDGNMISAQTPDDLPEFMKAILTAAGVQYTQIIQHK